MSAYAVCDMRMPTSSKTARPAWLQPSRWSGGVLAVLGVAALLLTLVLAEIGQPSVPEVTEEGCRARLAETLAAEAEADNADQIAALDATGALRLVGVWPSVTEIGDSLCVIVAGVTSSIATDQARIDVVRFKNALTAARAELESADRNGIPADITRAETAVTRDTASFESALRKAAADPAPTELTLYLNTREAPFTLKARSVDVPQHLYFPLIAPDSAEATDAEFWRHLVSNVAWARPDQWGSGEVVLGLSRKASEATVPEAVGANFTLYVYSWGPFITGLIALGFFTASFAVYAARTPLLRDNELRISDFYPGLYDTAITDDAQKRQQLAKAVANLAAQPQDAALIAAEADAGSKSKAAQDEVQRITSVLNFSEPLLLEHRAERDERKTEHDKLAETSKLAEANLQTSGTAIAALLPDAELRATKAKEAVTAAGSAARSAPTNQAVQDALKAATENAGAAYGFVDAVKLLSDPLALTRVVDDEAAAKKAAAEKLDALKKCEDEITVAKYHLEKAEAEHNRAHDEATRLEAEAARERVRVAETVRSAFDRFEPLRTAVEAKAKAKAKLAFVEQVYQHTETRTLWRAVGPYSLGRSQMAFWMFLTLAGYIYIAMSIGQVFGILNEKILVLLGISGATGLGSVLINGAEHVGKTTQGYINDVLSVGGTPQLQRIQALAWTGILGAVFVWLTMREYNFPVFDDTLLLLMGLVSGFYLGFKPSENKMAELNRPGFAGG